MPHVTRLILTRPAQGGFSEETLQEFLTKPHGAAPGLFADTSREALGHRDAPTLPLSPDVRHVRDTQPGGAQ